MGEISFLFAEIVVEGAFQRRFLGQEAKISLPVLPAQVPERIGRIPAKIRSRAHPLHGKLEQAAAYAAAIDQQAAAATTSLAQERLQTLSLHIADWQRKLERLAQQVIAFEQNSLLQKDLKEVPKAIKSLQKRVDVEENPQVKAELSRTLAQRERQWASLDKLQSTMRLAEVKAESTVSMLGTLYSQTQISASSGQVADYRHLLAEVDEESLALQDYLDALEEIKYGQPCICELSTQLRGKLNTVRRHGFDRYRAPG
jgi:uncharacterized protein YceH (UPF0502 family)